MVLFKLLVVLPFVAGVKTALMRRMGFDIQKPILNRINDPLNKLLMQKYFDFSNGVVNKSETYMKTTMSDVMNRYRTGMIDKKADLIKYEPKNTNITKFDDKSKTK